MSKVQIGWYYQRKEEVVCYAGYECAAWYENINLTPGRYPIMVDDYSEWKGEVRGRRACIIVDGTVVNDYFGSLFCGMPIGSYDSTKNKGKPSLYDKGGYLYSIARCAYVDPDFEIFPEYEIREKQFYVDYDMEYHSLYEFYVKGAK